MMKKLKWFLIPVLVLGLFALWVCLGPETYSLGLSLSDISSVEVYNESSLEKKVVSRQEDVEKVLKSIDSQYVRGPFEDSDIVNGGLAFVFVFHLTDGTDRVCTFVEASPCCFNDGSGAVKTTATGLYGQRLWEKLDYAPQKAIAWQEVPGMDSSGNFVSPVENGKGS